jgi:hypothetical protein
MAEFFAMLTEAVVPRNLRFSDRTTPADLVSISDADFTHPPRTECDRKMSPDIDILVVSHARDRATIARFLEDYVDRATGRDRRRTRVDRGRNAPSPYRMARNQEHHRVRVNRLASKKLGGSRNRWREPPTSVRATCKILTFW